MSFVKKLWKNRQSQHPSRRIMTRVDTGTSVTYDVERDEGTVSQVGDDFSAENMNDLESRIEQAFEDAGGGAFVGVKYHASLADYPGYPCWEDLTAEEKEKFDINNGATVNFLDDEAPSDIIGDTDISGIADGTLTGAVAGHEAKIDELLSALAKQPGYPDFNNLIKTLSTNSSYTATEDGWLCGFWYNSQASSYSHLNINGEAAGSAYTGGTSAYYSYGNIQLPIKKGDVITTGSNFSGSVRFYGKRV